jgi:hypothetical protein
MQIDWRNIVVRFYSGTSIVESDSLSSFGASTMADGEVRESVTVLTPSAQNVTGVTVSAQVRVQGAVGLSPSDKDVFGEILIN